MKKIPFFAFLIILWACTFGKEEPPPEPPKKVVKVNPWRSSTLKAGFKDGRIKTYSDALDYHLHGSVQADLVKEAFLLSARNEKLDPLFLLSIASTATNLDPNYSSSGKIGLIPITTEQAELASSLNNIKYRGENDLADPTKNLHLAAAHIKFLLEVLKNNYEHAVLAYSWDLNSVEETLAKRKRFPSEHSKFASKVIKFYKNATKKGPRPAKPNKLHSEGQHAYKPVYRLTRSQQYPRAQYTKFLKENVSHAGQANIEDIIGLVVDKSIERDFNPLFVASLVQIESTFNPLAKNGTKFGLLQIDSQNAEYLARLSKTKWLDITSLYDPEYNLEFGINILHLNHQVFGNNPQNSLAGFNWGMKNLIDALKANQEIPLVVQQYPQKVIKRFNIWFKKFQGEFGPIREAKPTEDATAKAASADAGDQNGGISDDSEYGVIKQMACQRMKNQFNCTMLSHDIFHTAIKYQSDPLSIAILAALTSNFNSKKVDDERYGLFQFTEEEAERIVGLVNMPWKDVKNLLNHKYAIRLASKYYSYLHKRFHGNQKHIAPAFFMADPDKLETIAKEKGTLPNDINTKSLQFLNKYKILSSKIE